MKKLILIAVAVLACACASSNSQVASDPTPPNQAAPAPTQGQNSYDRANAAADAAFNEFDNDLNGNAETGSSTSATGSNPPGNTGNAAYDRQQTAADDAFNELDCEIAGGENCSLPPTQSTPAPVETPAPETPIAEKPRPGSAVTEKSLDRGATKYPLANGYPIWFSLPSYDGYLGGVGVAKPQRVGGYATQRRVALVQAQADLARSVKVNVYSELAIERLVVSKDIQEHYQEKFSSYSRQQVDLFVGNPQVMDEWLDERTGELYIWVVLPK